MVTKVKLNINSAEVHPPLSNNRHLVDGMPVGAGSLWPFFPPNLPVGQRAWKTLGGIQVHIGAICQKVCLPPFLDRLGHLVEGLGFIGCARSEGTMHWCEIRA
jgi:hypothetical protein